MQLHQIKPNHIRKTKKRVGRGGKRGTYSGRGNKGQKARAGRRFQPIVREILKRYPKLRGYKFSSQDKNFVIVKLDDLQSKFSDGQLINPKILLGKGIIGRIKGRIPQVKILGNGSIKKKLTIQDCQISKSAQEKIEKAGGKVILSDEK